MSIMDDDEQAHADDAGFPCLQGLIAANVALMTAYANPAPDARLGAEAQSRLLARKVVSNLFFLREHPLLSPGLRQVMSNAHQHWVTLAAQAVPEPEPGWAAAAAGLRH